MENNLKYQVTLILGDKSGDGHSRTDHIKIYSNLSLKIIEKAYKNGVKIIGIDVINDIASDCEDNEISLKFLQKLRKLGFKYKKFEEEKADKSNKSGWFENGKICLENEDYIAIVLFIVWLGNEKFQYKVIKENYKNFWYIGGYGLFFD